jgi:hypothetical protein
MASQGGRSSSRHWTGDGLARQMGHPTFADLSWPRRRCRGPETGCERPVLGSPRPGALSLKVRQQWQPHRLRAWMCLGCSRASLVEEDLRPLWMVPAVVTVMALVGQRRLAQNRTRLPRAVTSKRPPGSARVVSATARLKPRDSGQNQLWVFGLDWIRIAVDLAPAQGWAVAHLSWRSLRRRRHWRGLPTTTATAEVHQLWSRPLGSIQKRRGQWERWCCRCWRRSSLRILLLHRRRHRRR